MTDGEDQVEDSGGDHVTTGNSVKDSSGRGGTQPGSSSGNLFNKTINKPHTTGAGNKTGGNSTSSAKQIASKDNQPTNKFKNANASTMVNKGSPNKGKPSTGASVGHAASKAPLGGSAGKSGGMTPASGSSRGSAGRRGDAESEEGSTRSTAQAAHAKAQQVQEGAQKVREAAEAAKIAAEGVSTSGGSLVKELLKRLGKAIIEGKVGEVSKRWGMRIAAIVAIPVVLIIFFVGAFFSIDIIGGEEAAQANEAAKNLTINVTGPTTGKPGDVLTYNIKASIPADIIGMDIIYTLPPNTEYDSATNNPTKNTTDGKTKIIWNTVNTANPSSADVNVVIRVLPNAKDTYITNIVEGIPIVELKDIAPQN